MSLILTNTFKIYLKKILKLITDSLIATKEGLIKFK